MVGAVMVWQAGEPAAASHSTQTMRKGERRLIDCARLNDFD
jgi:hypothetical protein